MIIKPCPFCGNTEIKLFKDYDYGGGAFAQIECQNCPAEMHRYGRDLDHAESNVIVV